MVYPAERVSHSGRVLRRAIHALGFMFALAGSLAAGETQAPVPPSPGDVPLEGRYAQVTVDPAKTSIYIGSVSLTMSPFVRCSGGYQTDYTAKVFPFFFYNEHGRISIEFSDENLRQLRRGETAYFKGRAHSSDGDERRIEGRAIPADAAHGKIKVRVWIGRIELIFNTVYRFSGQD